MGDKSHSTTAQDTRSILSRRVAGINCFCARWTNYLKPLFHEELLDATKLHEEILEHPDPTIFEHPHALRQLKHLDSIDATLTEHWQDLHTSLHSREVLLANILGFQRFLAKSIMMDYAGSPLRDAVLEPWA